MSRSRLAALGVTVLLLLLTGCSSGSGSEPPPTSTPAPSQVSIEAALDRMVVDGSASYANTQTVVASRGGQTVAERFYGADAGSYADVQSVTKSVVSTLVGIALADGELQSSGPDGRGTAAAAPLGDEHEELGHLRLQQRHAARVGRHPGEGHR